MSRIFALSNTAGGVGRTTSALSMAVAFSEYGKKVLLVDLDPQGALTFTLGKENSRRSAYDIFSGRERALGMIHQTGERVDLIPSSHKLSVLLNAKDMKNDQILFNALEKFEYDVIIIDTGASMSRLNQLVLSTVDEIFIPTRLDLIAARGALEVASAVEKYRGKVRAVLPTMVESRSKHGQEMLTLLKEKFGKLVIEPGIPKSPLFFDAAVAGASLLNYRKASEISGLYREITYDFL
ncbi:MAG: ParA family protein [Actinobacteria bacterium]|uniref:ParA family protein n=1 Tax=Candidatus Fonsibacter lacus TaxID=2576439 RepID=A0A965GE31_9PROT|nr:ParA family protein [Candidatus Fonsibacter lacus]